MFDREYARNTYASALAKRIKLICMYKKLLLFFIFSAWFNSLELKTQEAFEKVVTRIAFGSCANQNAEQIIWSAVNDWNPDVFMFLGDNIYGDTENMDHLKAQYEKLGQKPGYQTLKDNAFIVATWDDHDYGVNDGGLEYPKKEESKKVMLDFFEEPDGSERWQHPGIYHSYLFGPAEQRVQLILLDVRTFRTKLSSSPRDDRMSERFMGSYTPTIDQESTMLGEDQWEWLEKQLQIPAKVRLFGMSTQFLAEFNGWEAWANMPLEKERMIQLIRKTKAEGVIFLSGDTHWAELSMVEEEGLYPLYDLTSSGLTNVWSGVAPNKNRIKKPFLNKNFGFVEIDWSLQDPKIGLGVIDVNGEEKIFHSFGLSSLNNPKYTLEKKLISSSIYRNIFTPKFEGTWDSSYGLMKIDKVKEKGKTYYLGSYKDPETGLQSGTFKGLITRMNDEIVLKAEWKNPSSKPSSGQVRFSLSGNQNFMFGEWKFSDEKNYRYSWSAERIKE
ncbi:metallophosphatase [bacterium]|nr:metallophosphatase [bacterium]